MGAMVSQITSLTNVYSTVYSGADQRKHQSSASLAFVRGMHRWLVNSPHKGPVTREMFPFDDVIMEVPRDFVRSRYRFRMRSSDRRKSSLFNSDAMNDIHVWSDLFLFTVTRWQATCIPRDVEPPLSKAMAQSYMSDDLSVSVGGWMGWLSNRNIVLKFIRRWHDIFTCIWNKQLCGGAQWCSHNWPRSW